mgnify:CR=1 FL=1
MAYAQHRASQRNHGRKQAEKEKAKAEKEKAKAEKEKAKAEKEKAKTEEERQKQELIKARAQVTGPKQVGKIELNPKPAPSIQKEEIVSQEKEEIKTVEPSTNTNVAETVKEKEEPVIENATEIKE